MSKRKKVSFETSTIYKFNKKGYDYDGIRWVLRARSTDMDAYDGRRLSFIECKDNYWTATDGHRLHCYESSGFDDYEDGVYEVLINKANEVTLQKDINAPRLPDWEAVFPPYNAYKEKLFVVFFDHDISWAYAKIIRALDTATLKVRYLEDLGSCGDDFNVYIYEDNMPVCFCNEKDKIAIIMTMK